MSGNKPNNAILKAEDGKLCEESSSLRTNIITFVPRHEILNFRSTSIRSTVVSPTDPFISKDGLHTFSSLFSKEKDALPKYIIPFREFVDKVTDFSETEIADINAHQAERVKRKREVEKGQEQVLAKKAAAELKEKKALDKKVSNFLQRKNYYVKRTCPVRIPFKSTLSHQEHEFYLRSFIKFQICPYKTKHEEEEYHAYVSMQDRVFEEQSCLMNFSYKVAQLVLDEYNTLPPTIENYIRSCVSHRCQRALAYPQNYQPELKIPIKPQDPLTRNSNFQFNHIGHLLSLGQVPIQQLPSPYARNILPNSESVARDRRSDSDQCFDKNSFLYKCPVSEDPNAEYLAKQHNANVVISASAFKIIVDNQEQPFDKYWNIPVVVKSYTVKGEHGNDKQLRVVYIDKPLAKLSWYPLEMKSAFYKQSFLSKFTCGKNTPLYSMRNPVAYPGTEKRRCNSDNVYSDDVFGMHSSSVTDVFGSVQSSVISRHESSTVRTLSSTSGLPMREVTEEHPLQGSESSTSNTSEVPKCNLEEDLFLTDEDDDDDHSSLSTLKVEESEGGLAQAGIQSVSQDANSTAIICNDKAVSCTVQHHVDKVKSHKPVSQSKRFGVPTDTSSQPVRPAIQSNQPSSTVPSSENKEVRNPVQGDSTEASVGFLDNLLDKQSNFLKIASLTQNYNQCPVPPNLLQFEDVDFNKRKKFKMQPPVMPWSRSIFTDWSNCQGLKECPQGSGVNVHYQLFSFERTSTCATRDASEPLRIIVRHNIHGFSKVKKPVQKQKQSQAFIMFPKMENQVYFGCEVGSLSEITQQWASLIVRPNTTLLNVRVCVESGAVVMTEERTVDTVLKDGKQSHIRFDPQGPLATLHAVFNSLTKMSSGHYMLHHSNKTEAFISLMKSIGPASDVSQSHLELRNIYAGGSLVIRRYVTAPWLAIDTHVLTPFHIAHKKIPGTFPMENTVQKLDKRERRKRRQKAESKKILSEFDSQKPSQKASEDKKEEITEPKSKRRYF